MEGFMTRKCFSIMLILAVMFFAVSCGGDDDPKDEKNPDNETTDNETADNEIADDNETPDDATDENTCDTAEEKKCSDDNKKILNCRDGVWQEWDDCEAEGMVCAFKWEEYLCIGN